MKRQVTVDAIGVNAGGGIMDQKVRCENCGWKGSRSDLTFYDNPRVAWDQDQNYCPKCGSNNYEIINDDEKQESVT